MFSLDPCYVRVVGGDPTSKRWVSSPSPHLHFCVSNLCSSWIEVHVWFCNKLLLNFNLFLQLCHPPILVLCGHVIHTSMWKGEHEVRVKHLSCRGFCRLGKFDSLVYLLVGKFSEAQHRIRYLGVVRLLFSIIGQLLQLLSTIVCSMVEILGEDLCIHNLRLQHTCTSNKYIYVKEFSKWFLLMLHHR